MNVKNSLDLLLNDCSNGGCVSPFAIGAMQIPNLLDYSIFWNSTPDVTTFACQYQLQGSGNWILIENINATNVILTGLLACTTYEVQLASVCGGVQGAWTSSFLFTTEGCCVNPNAYSVPNAQGATTASVAWDNVFAAQGYSIQLTGPNGTTIFESIEPNYLFTGLDSCTTYTIQVTSVCVNPENPITPFDFSTTGCGSCTDIVYCDANGGDATAEFISAVSVGTFTNTNTTNANYTDYTNLSTFTLVGGNTYPITLTPGFAAGAYSEYFKVWIDYNANGTFDEPMELAFDAGSGSQAAVTGTITVPINLAISPGSTRMRVGMSYVGTFGAGTPPSACGAYGYGEVEDYCVTIQWSDAVETIAAPMNLQVYPNPAKETIQLNLPSNIQRFQLRILSNDGKCVKQMTTDSRSISVSDLAAGYYIVEVVSESGIARTKICVE